MWSLKFISQADFTKQICMVLNEVVTNSAANIIPNVLALYMLGFSSYKGFNKIVS